MMKSYLQMTISQEKLNELVILSIRNNILTKLNNEFCIPKNENNYFK